MNDDGSIVYNKNQIKVIPDSIANLTNLRSLALSNNGIKEVPDLPISSLKYVNLEGIPLLPSTLVFLGKYLKKIKISVTYDKPEYLSFIHI